VHSNTCPVDGWLTLSAGERAGDRDAGADSRPPCRALREPAADGAVPGWATYRRIAAGKDFDARLGLLGDELARGAGCVRPIGPGAALAAATSAGTVTGYAPYDARTLRAQLAACPVSFVDVGSLWGSADDPSQVSVLDSQLMRVAGGFGIQWISPFGPIRVDYAIPIQKEYFDKTENFRFSFGTRF